MRRLAVLVSLVSLLIAGAPAASSAPGVFAGGEQFADAIWIGYGDDPDFYFGFGFRYVDPTAGVVTIGGIGKGSCEKDRGRNYTVLICSASGRAKEIPFEDFDMDPALASARLDVKMAGRSHTVEWEGTGRAPTAGAQAAASDCGAQAFGGAIRGAKVSGRLFGNRLSPKTSSESFGILGAAGGAALFADGCRATLHDDGTVTYEATFRVSA